jgi:AcrR family transcriptional regulator
VNETTLMTLRDRLPSKGELTRQAILQVAADLASIEGLEGLTIGNLAKAVGMSKGGLYAHFRSKLELQLATIEAAGKIVDREIGVPTRAAPPGLRRLWTLCESYLSYGERKVFPGGCFFGNAAAEMDAKPGVLRDKIKAAHSKVIARMGERVQEAQALGELDAKADPHQLAFEFVSFIREAARLFLMDDDSSHFARARYAIAQRLRPLLTDKSPALPEIPAPKRRERVAGTP